jgi:choline dehydrogenase-like flavoprotein
MEQSFSLACCASIRRTPRLIPRNISRAIRPSTACRQRRSPLRNAVNVQGKYQTKEVWHDRDGNPLHPHTNYCVGGNTKFYGAALFHLRREDFCTIEHHGGVSPAWPISYDELESYYMAWGDDDGKTLYLCARGGLYKMRLNIPGIRP